MLGTHAAAELPWRRRPRRPLPALLQDWRIWFLPAFLVGVFLLVGLGILVSAPHWWGRVAGGGISAACLGLATWALLYVRRPVVDDRFDENAPWVTATIATWRERMARDGFVEIRLSARKVFWTGVLILTILAFSVALVLGLTGLFGRFIGLVALVVCVPLGVLPNLEFATAHGPALRVDSLGIRVARWRTLQIPWSELVAADLYATGNRRAVMSQNAVLYVTPEWYAAYQEKRPFLRRAAEQVQARYTRGPSFTIPSTIDARAFALSLWLDEEIVRHNPSVRPDDHQPG
jgi:hypothetical protein